MKYGMERWHSAAHQRFSVRKYAGEPGDAELAALEAAANMLSVDGMRIALCKNTGVFSIAPLYGKIAGTDCFAAFISSGASNETIGYIGEAFILECTALGLGTCWVGGTYAKKRAIDAASLSDGEKLICVTPMGIAAESYAARPRKDIEKLTGMTNEQLFELPDWQKEALACARSAPSAINNQPWRFGVIDDGLFIQPAGNNFGFGELDRGIAMLHMELGAAHCSVSGEWEKRASKRVFVPHADI